MAMRTCFPGQPCSPAATMTPATLHPACANAAALRNECTPLHQEAALDCVYDLMASGFTTSPGGQQQLHDWHMPLFAGCLQSIVLGELL
jgi:hypothetical protein